MRRQSQHGHRAVLAMREGRAWARCDRVDGRSGVDGSPGHDVLGRHPRAVRQSDLAGTHLSFFSEKNNRMLRCEPKRLLNLAPEPNANSDFAGAVLECSVPCRVVRRVVEALFELCRSHLQPQLLLWPDVPFFLFITENRALRTLQNQACYFIYLFFFGPVNVLPSR